MKRNLSSRYNTCAFSSRSFCDGFWHAEMISRAFFGSFRRYKQYALSKARDLQ